MSEDCVFENTSPAPDGEVYSGKTEISQFWQGFFRQSPHAHFEIEEIFGLGNRCLMRWRYTWRDADGVDGHVRGVDIFKVSDSPANTGDSTVNHIAHSHLSA
jgi:predicted SnoaL-like aldol condensation-catalyzing enzyme